MNVRQLLNKLRWHPDYDFNGVKIWYISRGKRGDIDFIIGSEIKSMGNIFIETENAMIPYHRIMKIEYNGNTIFEK